MRFSFGPGRATPAFLAANLLLGAVAPAGAQSFLGRGAPQALSVPGDEASGPRPDPGTRQPDAPRTAPVRASQTAVSTAPAPLPQRPLPAIGESLRLKGEESALQWPVYVTAEQARERLRFRVGYLAAISVVPEASTLTASVNDVVLGHRPSGRPAPSGSSSSTSPPACSSPATTPSRSRPSSATASIARCRPPTNCGRRSIRPGRAS
ncbi:cellulose biosynthesis cyclic di-GMP-binding regulatory protein BcsB [Methylobacterium phyllosphaerae]